MTSTSRELNWKLESTFDLNALWEEMFHSEESKLAEEIKEAALVKPDGGEAVYQGEGAGEEAKAALKAIDQKAAVMTSTKFLTMVETFLEAIISAAPAQLKHLQHDLTNMMACKAWPAVFHKVAKNAEALGLKGLANKLWDWKKFLRITPCKYSDEKTAKDINSQGQTLAKELMESFGSVQSWDPMKILQSACFSKNADVCYDFQEDLIDALKLTEKGSSWMSKAKQEKMA